MFRSFEEFRKEDDDKFKEGKKLNEGSGDNGNNDFGISETPKIKIHCLLNRDNFGDQRHVKGINDAVEYYLGKKIDMDNVEIEILPFYEDPTFKEGCGALVELKEKLLESNRERNNVMDFVIGSGEYGLNAVEALQKDSEINKDNLFITWSGHRNFDKLESFFEGIDVISLPKHIPDPDFSNEAKERLWKEKRVAPVSVPHNISEKMLAEIYQSWPEEKKEKLEKKITPETVFVFLGGDTSAVVDGKEYIRRFTPTEAQNLAVFIKENFIEKQSDVFLEGNLVRMVVVIHPRTGKYNKKNLKNEGIHGGKSDPTSDAFLGEFKDFEENIAFFDFVRGSYDYEACLHLAAENKSFVIGPGCSISMLSEILSRLYSDRFYIPRMGSMDPDAVRHMDNLFVGGYCNQITNYGREKGEYRLIEPSRMSTEKFSAENRPSFEIASITLDKMLERFDFLKPKNKSRKRNGYSFGQN